MVSSEWRRTGGRLPERENTSALCLCKRPFKYSQAASIPSKILVLDYDTRANICYCYSQNVNMVRGCLEHSSALFYACYGKNTELVTYLIDEIQLDVNSANDLVKHLTLFLPSCLEKTPCIWACQTEKSLSVIRLLEQYNANCQQKCKLGQSGIHHAAMSGSIDTLKYLATTDLRID